VVPMLDEGAGSSAEHLLGTRIDAPSLPTTEDPPDSLRRISEGPLEPGFEGLIQQPLGFPLLGDLEERVDSRLERPLAEEIRAEGVDRADPCELEVAESRLEAGFLLAIEATRGPRVLDLRADPELHLSRRFLREGHRHDPVESSTSAADESDDSRDESGRFPRTGRRLDKESRVELLTDPPPVLSVGQRLRGMRGQG